MKKPTTHSEYEKTVRQMIGELALFGLLAEIVNPTCPPLKVEAERILFSEPPTTKKKQLCELMNLTEAALNANIAAALQAADYKLTNH
jgi:hypothetical protein